MIWKPELQQIAGLLEVRSRLWRLKLSGARNAWSVLDLDRANAAATDGLVMVAALEDIAEEVKIIRT